MDKGVKRRTILAAMFGGSMEFYLIVAFLAALVGLVILILWMPADFITGSYDATTEEIIGFKKDLLAIILTAFGAWIGAGAAYFFGRENLREAVAGMKAAQGRNTEDATDSKA